MTEPRKIVEYRQPAAFDLRKRAVRRWIIRGLLILAATVVVLVLVVAGMIWRFESVLQGNLAKADAHLPVLQARVAGDSRFADVHFDHFTGANGSLFVGGSVASQADFDALKQIVQSTSPPVYVYWSIAVAAPAKTQPMSPASTASSSMRR